ncbi:hypothetical protein N2152v2_005690 [Parachlorella kessleri]
MLVQGPAAGAEVKCTLLTNRAAARLQLEDAIGALLDANSALALDARRAKAWYRQALALQQLQCWEAALAAAQQCIPLSEGLARQEAQQLVEALHQQHHPTGQTGALVEARLPVTLGSLPAQFAKLPWEYVPPCDGVHENLLVLFHGLGDNPAAFARLARQMQLPQTAALALCGPLSVPFTECGRSWYAAFDDQFELIKGAPGETRRLHSLDATLDALQRLLRMLWQRCGWPPHSIHLLGFSQGGTVALELALRQAAGGQGLGSCVVVSAALLEERLVLPFSSAYQPSSAQQGIEGRQHDSSGSVRADCHLHERRGACKGMGVAQGPEVIAALGGAAAAAAAAAAINSLLGESHQQQNTPVLITHGSADAVLPRSLVEQSVQYMRSVPGMGEVLLQSVPSKGHSMVQGREEMETIMHFWSRHLSRRPTDADSLPGGAANGFMEVRPGEVSLEKLTSGAAS